MWSCCRGEIDSDGCEKPPHAEENYAFQQSAVAAEQMDEKPQAVVPVPDTGDDNSLPPLGAFSSGSIRELNQWFKGLLPRKRRRRPPVEDDFSDAGDDLSDLELSQGKRNPAPPELPRSNCQGGGNGGRRGRHFSWLGLTK
jgi:hypothetical protein